ncbi:hypothetical protein VP01_1144g4 [Puccinia sorghi]|uniref:Plastocyanin-like domain-containing protein n=1 Tax=Puccinia sorghi TaxID=27349 RepID=A0A0L6VRW2_9BASI|nr:hypothetical protein VP01_1144g4 [Puccinia sorghi]
MLPQPATRKPSLEKSACVSQAKMWPRSLSCSPILRILLLNYCATFIAASPLHNHPLPDHHPSAFAAHPQEYVLRPEFQISDKPTTRRYTFNVTQSTAALDGFLRPVLAINGQIPGPLIEVPLLPFIFSPCANEGDRLEITVMNYMDVGLTIHWHGLYQARYVALFFLIIFNIVWEDGVTGQCPPNLSVTQCPIPPNGGKYTYKFNLDGQLSFALDIHENRHLKNPAQVFVLAEISRNGTLYGTKHKSFFTVILHRDGPQFTSDSHHQNLMADGISGPLIIHSPRDPLKRYRDFDQEVVLVLADWYHNTSSDIVAHMLSEAGYFGTPAAPGPNSALMNGVGEWNCSAATRAQQCQQINSPPQFTFKAGEKIRFRLINAGAHAMFFYSVDQHTLNVTEADATGVYGPPALHRVWLHNGQRYSVVIKTKEEDAGKSFYLRATMDSDCWAWVPNDIQLTAFGILRLLKEASQLTELSQARPTTQDWSDEILGDCVDLETSSMVPIMKQSVPRSAKGSGSFQAGFGFQFINNTAEHYTRAEAVIIAQQANASSLSLTTNPRTEELNTTSDPSNFLGNGTKTNLLTKRTPLQAWLPRAHGKPESLTFAYGKRQVPVGQQDLPTGNRTNELGITRTGGPPPTPIGTIGKFFLNNISWTTYPYQPVLHDLTPGGVGAVNGSNVANVVYPTAEWYDLYLANIDPAGSHPYHMVSIMSSCGTLWTCISLAREEAYLHPKTWPTLRTIPTIHCEEHAHDLIPFCTFLSETPSSCPQLPSRLFAFVQIFPGLGLSYVSPSISSHVVVNLYYLLFCLPFFSGSALSHRLAHPVVRLIFFFSLLPVGFAGVVVVQPDVIKGFKIPKENLDLCKARIGPLDTIEPGLLL